MDRVAVSSSNIASVGYDPSTMTLEIEFCSGSVYQYFDVPESVHLQLMQSSSVGGYFSSSIRNSFRYAQT